MARSYDATLSCNNCVNGNHSNDAMNMQAAAAAKLAE